MNTSRGIAVKRAAAAVALLCMSSVRVDAQFLRLGPLDFDAVASLEGVYTTNVDGARPSQTTKEQEDYYMVAALNLKSSSSVLRNSTLDVDTGIAVEKHAKRKDLDTLSEPFGNARIDNTTRSGRYTLHLNAFMGKTARTQQGTYISGTFMKRDVNTVSGYGAELTWVRGKIRWQARGSYARERHQDPEFQTGDRNSKDLGFGAAWTFSKRVSLRYDYSRSRTVTINEPDSYSGWDESQNAGLEVRLLTRPLLTYALGVENQMSQGVQEGWEPTHTLAISDTRSLSKKLSLSADATYRKEQTKDVNDISFTYSVSMNHALSRTARQELRLTREPVNTFGSTIDTDSTTVDYSFQKADLFMYHLNLVLGISYARNKPLGAPPPPVVTSAESMAVETASTEVAPSGEAEETWTYSASLSYDRKVSRKLSRSLAYGYSYEESNFVDEPLEEHRVTLTYKYAF
ncbi:MAG: hypothetical protein V1873_03380 [Verrucomicrobiota bacterium]